MGQVTWQTDDNGDLIIANGSPIWIDGKDAITQHLRSRLRAFAGEWFLDESVGVPWYRDVLVKNPQFSVVAAAIKKAILETPGVVALQSFKLDFVATRTLTLDFSVDTIDGVVDYSLPVEA